MSQLSRREFARYVGIGTAGVVVGNSINRDDQKTVPAVEPVKAERPPGDDVALIERRLVEIIQRRYPHQNLTPHVLAEIRSEIRSDLARSNAIRDYRLKNSDEPGFVFRAYRSEPVVS